MNSEETLQLRRKDARLRLDLLSLNEADAVLRADPSECCFFRGAKMIQLSDHFTYKKLLRYTLPSVIMLVFTSIYGVVDGFFVSNFVGKTPFTAVNFIMPFLMILGSLGFMFGTGGGALIAKTLGEGDREKANKTFSLIVYVSAAGGLVLAALGILFIRPFAVLLGAEGQLLTDSVTYGRIILLAIPAYILQFEFQCLFATAEKPTLGLLVTVAAGLTNMVLDGVVWSRCFRGDSKARQRRRQSASVLAGLYH